MDQTVFSGHGYPQKLTAGLAVCTKAAQGQVNQYVRADGERSTQAPPTARKWQKGTAARERVSAFPKAGIPGRLTMLQWMAPRPSPHTDVGSVS